ncbi:MAG: ABC transporter permease [Thermoplasmata archaeon]|nr:ABC transporter permease [Thermoplasmata archaeon]
MAAPVTRTPNLLRVLWTNAVFAPRTTLGFMRIDYVLGTVLIVPFTQMLFFAVVAQLAGNPSAPVAFVVLGNAIAPVTYSSIFSVCQTTDSEKHQGTMEHLLVSPTNRAALYLGRGLLPILASVATLAVGLLYAAFLFHVPFAAGSTGPIAISVGLLSVSMVGFGLLLGGVALFLRTSIILGNIFLFIGLLLSGANFPVSFLPLPLVWLGYLLPLTWGISAIRATAAGAGLMTLLPLWGALVLSTAITLGLAMGLWGVFERQALRTGSIVRF